MSWKHFQGVDGPEDLLARRAVGVGQPSAAKRKHGGCFCNHMQGIRIYRTMIGSRDQVTAGFVWQVSRDERRWARSTNGQPRNPCLQNRPSLTRCRVPRWESSRIRKEEDRPAMSARLAICPDDTSTRSTGENQWYQDASISYPNFRIDWNPCAPCSC